MILVFCREMLEKIENRSIITNTVIEKEQKQTVEQRDFCSFLLMKLSYGTKRDRA